MKIRNSKATLDAQQYCESVMRSIHEPSDTPTVEQLAADYRNRRDYAERLQREADAARAAADETLTALGEACRVLVESAAK